MHTLSVILLLVLSLEQLYSWRLAHVAKLGICSALLLNSPITHASTLTEELKTFSDTQKVLDAADIPFIELGNGLSYREFRSGRGNAMLQKDSIVTTDMVIRMKSFATDKEPGGVAYFNSKTDGEISWTIGSGQIFPELEAAMMADGGMKKGAIRRVDVPSVTVFKARNDKSLPLPTSDDGQRRFKNLFKTKADLLIEILVKKIDNSNVAQ
jgi:hypothetical protein